MWPAIETLVPSIGILFLLYVVLKYMMEGDRRERIAQAQWEQEHQQPTPDVDHNSESTSSAQDG